MRRKPTLRRQSRQIPGSTPEQSSRLSPSGSGDAGTAHLQSSRSEVLCCLKNGRYQSSALIVTPAIRSNTLMMAEPSSLFSPAARAI
jgi:hypothetical protein